MVTFPRGDIKRKTKSIHQSTWSRWKGPVLSMMAMDTGRIKE